MAKRILVTGGAGFLGSHLCERLLKKGYHVLALDNLLTGSQKNIQNCLVNPRFQLICQDVIQPFDAPVDEIYNLACPASPVHYQADPIQTLKTNVIGTLNMLELAKRNRAKIFQASTSEVYGDPQIHPQVESHWGHVNPIGIRACYDEGKRAAETLCFDYHRMHAVPIKVARIFNTYGPCMDPQDGRVVSNFIVQALRKESMTIYGKGTQTRSFCYVDDLISGCIEFMENSAHDFCGPMNLGNPNEFTILQLAETVQQIIGSSAPLVFKPLPLDDPKQRRPDISLAKQTLGWVPQVQLEEGLKKTIHYFDREQVFCF